jgi:hypothetical protein
MQEDKPMNKLPGCGRMKDKRTLLPVAPTGVTMPPRTAGFVNRDRLELKWKDWIAPAGQDNSASGMPPVAE